MIFIFCGKITGRVYGQSLALGPAFPVSDTIDYITAEFTFETPDWDGVEKWVHFTKDDKAFVAKLTDNKLSADKHINLAAGVWEIYLHGNKDGTRITTNVCLLKVKPTGVIDGKPLPEVPLTAAEQIALDADKALKKAEEASDKAELAIRKADEISEVKTEVGKIKNDVADIKKAVEHISEEKVKEYADRAEKAARDIAVKADNHENRLSNLESAITGKITETVTFADKIEAKGRTLPAAVLPYARLNRIGGITKATSVTANDVKTWTDTPSDIKYIRTRGYNQGGVIKDVTTNPFHVKLETKGSADTTYDDYSYATECTLTEDGKLRIFASEYYLNLQKGDKIRITINSSTVDGATFVGGSLEKVPVTTNTSGSVYVFENAKDYLYVYPPTQNVDNYLINNAAARIYGDTAYVGDISYIGYNAGKEWTAKNPNETYNWRVKEYYYEATVKEDNASHLDWTIPLGVFNYDPTENMTAEEKQAFNPQTDFKKYSLPADCYRPYEESITALPDTDKPLHGFSKNYSNWLTFGDDEAVDYTDNYVKYVCNILKYESFYGSTDEYYFNDATVTVPLSDAGWAGMTATNKISWDHWYPDKTDLRVTDGTSVEEMTTYLSENKGLFAARTKMNSNGETITTEKVADGYSPYIPVYEKGIIQLLDSNKKPTDGILDITYQTKKTEA